MKSWNPWRWKNWGCKYVVNGGENLHPPPLVGIGLTDLPKIGSGPPAPLGSGITALWKTLYDLRTLCIDAEIFGPHGLMGRFRAKIYQEHAKAFSSSQDVYIEYLVINLTKSDIIKRSNAISLNILFDEKTILHKTHLPFCSNINEQRWKGTFHLLATFNRLVNENWANTFHMHYLSRFVRGIIWQDYFAAFFSNNPCDVICVVDEVCCTKVAIAKKSCILF